jgi:hypothetical protein
VRECIGRREKKREKVYLDEKNLKVGTSVKKRGDEKIVWVWDEFLLYTHEP